MEVCYYIKVAGYGDGKIKVLLQSYQLNL